MKEEPVTIRPPRWNAMCSITGMALASALAVAGWGQTHPGASLPALTEVAQIRRLTPAEAKRKYPIRLTGVITYHSPDYQVTFVQDKTAGIFIYNDTNAQIGAGSLVEVDGNTTPGDFAPSIEHPEVRVLGRAPLPAAAPRSLDALMTGSEDSQWVKVQGIVQSVTIEDRLPPDMRAGPPQLVLEIHSGSGSFKARIRQFRRDADYSRLVDAPVTVRGVCGILFNSRMQLVGIQLFVPDLEQVTVDREAAADAYAPPVVAIGSLMRFSPGRIAGRRAHIRGVVTLSSPGSVFVQDDSGGVLVESGQPAAVERGDLVDAAGFPAAGAYAPILMNGSFRKIGKGRLPAPSDLTGAASLSSSDHDAEVVQVGGRLLAQSLIEEQLILTMELGGRTFTGILKETAGAQQVRSIRNGSQLRMTGVWWVETDEYHHAVGHRVLLRSAADIAVIRPAPWMTGSRILYLLGGLAGVFLLSLLWVAVLRRRVQEKTETLRAALERLRALSAAVEQSPVSIVITDLEGNVEYVNPKFTDVTGYTSEESLGRNPRILKSGETSGEEYRTLWETIKSGAAWKGTFHNKKKNGELYWESAAICAIRDEQGAPTHYLAVKEDITQRRLAVEALQESERRYRGLFEHMLEGFAYCQMVSGNGDAPDFIHLAVNDAFETLTGLKDVVGKRITDLVPGIRETDPGLLEAWARVARTGRSEKFEIYIKAMQKWNSMALYSQERGFFIAVFDDITERKRSEEALHLTQSAMDQAPFSVLWLDPGGSVVYANEAAGHELGYSRQEILALTVPDFDPDLTQELWRAAWSNLKASSSLLFEAWRRNKNGQVFPVEVSAKHLEFAGRELSCTFSRDITDRKRAEDALRTSQERFRIAAESASDIVFEFDLEDGRIQYFGDHLQERFPKIRFPATLPEWFSMLHEDDRDKIAAAVRLHLASREPLREEYRLLQDDDSIFEGAIRATITRDPVSGRNKSIGAIRDITRQKAAEQTNAELAAIVKVTDGAIIRKDASGRILTWNSGAERMYGYAASEMIGQTTSALLPPDRVQEWEAIEESLARGSEVNHCETLRITKTGERIDVMLTASPIRDGAGNVIGSAHIAWNISARKRLERQLSQAQKLESIGQLAAGIAHEINTPIQYIGDNARFLGDAFQDLFKVVGRLREPAVSRLGVDGSSATLLEWPPEDVDVDYLQREVPAAVAQLEEGVTNVARIVRAMKEFSHPGPAAKSGVDISRALESTILVSRNEWKYVAEMISDFDPELPPVPCVAGEMNQVFLNLIVNAAHAIADVVGNSGRKGSITVSTRRNGDWAEIRVQDTGSGIPDEIRSRIFDPFFTTKEVGKGTGQGLSIAHAVVVQKHQGTIDFESSVGKGTTFLVRLPLG